MVHWLYHTKPRAGEPKTDWNQIVDSFQLDGFIEQFSSTGAGHLIFTLGQNNGYYCSPNPVLESVLPGRCSNTDLALKIADRITETGARFIAYLPSEVDAADEELRNAFGWDLDSVGKQDFQQRYQKFIQAWAEKFGTKLSGWWFDGCYDQHSWTRTEHWSNQRFDFAAWNACARAGNPDALVAFNNGVGSFIAIAQDQDYAAGEADDLSYLPADRFYAYTQWHVLTHIDCFWAHTEKSCPIVPPRYSDEELFTYVRKCKEKKGAVTLNMGIYQDGLMAEDSIRQLQRLSAYLEDLGL